MCGAAHRQVGLITFNNELTLYGDGSAAPVTVAGDKLSDQSALQAIGAQYQGLKAGIGQVKNTLTKKLWDLKEGGQTALGPALVTAVAMAAEKRGSQVILCTDGLANIGMCELDGGMAGCGTCCVCVDVC